MQLYYNGVDITDSVNVISAIHRDVSGGRSDCLDVELDHAEAWHRWQPQQGDTLEMVHAGYTTGILYLTAIAPEGDAYRILATGAKPGMNDRRWQSFRMKRLSEIVDVCAAESGMGSRLYGLDASLRYPFLLRCNEGCAAFLSRLMKWEGAVLKCVNGRYTAIGVRAAQQLTAQMLVKIDADQQGVRYIRQNDKKLSAITVRTPYASVAAYDSGAAQNPEKVLTNLPALDEVTAGRWARGMLLMQNRQAEQLTIDAEFNPGYTAMARVDVESAADAAGSWLVDEVEHDFVRMTSRAKLLRCVETVV